MEDTVYSSKASKKYYLKHKELCLEKNVKWVKGHIEKSREIKRKWSRAHSEEGSERMRRWKLENPEKVKIQRRKYKMKHKEKVWFYTQIRRSRMKAVVGSHTLKEWKNIKEYYNHMCLCCKKFEPEIKLSQDHIIPVSRGGTDFIDNIQPLCTLCNSIKCVKDTDYRKKI